MEVTLGNFSEAIMSKVKDRIKFTPSNAEAIGSRIGIDISSRIVAGEAAPPSKKTFDRNGRRSPNPTLWETGEYASDFKGEFVSDSEMWIVNTSHVSPQWPRIKERSLSVVNTETAKTIIQEELLK